MILKNHDFIRNIFILVKTCENLDYFRKILFLVKISDKYRLWSNYLKTTDFGQYYRKVSIVVKF